MLTSTALAGQQVAKKSPYMSATLYFYTSTDSHTHELHGVGDFLFCFYFLGGVKAN